MTFRAGTTFRTTGGESDTYGPLVAGTIDTRFIK